MKQIIRNDKLVGVIDDRILRKTVRKSAHMLREPEGWAIDANILDEDFDEVRIHDTEENKYYKAMKQSFFDHGIPINRGHGQQVVLPLFRWHSAAGNSLFDEVKV